MLHRLLDTATLVEVIERPEVAPLVDGFDPAAWIADRRNVALSDAGGNVMLFERRGEALYEAHILFLARGRAALDLARTMLAAMFDMWGATAIYALPPCSRPAVRWFARQLGFAAIGSVERPMGQCDIFVLRADQLRG